MWVYKANKGVVYDTFAWILTLTAFLVFVMVEIEAVNLNDFSQAIQGLLGIILMVLGLLFTIVTVGVDVDTQVSHREAVQVFKLFLIGFMALAGIMILRRALFPTSILTPNLMVVLLAISETVFLVGLYELFSYTSRGNWVVAMFAVSIFWAVGHIYVYKLDFSILIAIVLVGLILLGVYNASGKRISVPILIHLLNNVLVVASVMGISLILLASLPLLFILAMVGGGK